MTRLDVALLPLLLSGDLQPDKVTQSCLIVVLDVRVGKRCMSQYPISNGRTDGPARVPHNFTLADRYRWRLVSEQRKTPTGDDMAPTKKPQKNAKKEKIFHPESRKAEQLARKQLRKSKLAEQASNRAKLHSSKGKC